MSNSATHIPKSSGWFVVGTLILLAAAAFAVMFMRQSQADLPAEDASRIEERVKVREELAASNQERLTTYAWIDKATGIVQIPIAQAMDLVVAERQDGEPTPAGPIVPVLPAPIPAAPTVQPSPVEAAGTAQSPDAESTTPSPNP
jgi:hypothetical protein